MQWNFEYKDFSCNDIELNDIAQVIRPKTLLTHFSQCSISMPPENVKKPKVFWWLQGVQKRNTGIKLIEYYITFFWNTGELRKNINPKLSLYSEIGAKNEKI